MAVISLAIQKGGQGKTLTSINLAGVFSSMGKRVLLIDNDQQGNTSKIFFPNYNSLQKTICEVLNPSPIDITEAILKTDFENLWVLPSNARFSQFRAFVSMDPNMFYLLRDVLAQIKNRFDFILIDCPPALDYATRSALIASDFVLGPIYPDSFTLDGMKSLDALIQSVQQNNSHLKSLGYFLNNFQMNNSTEIYLDEIKKYLGERLFETTVKRRTAIEQIQIVRKPMIYEAPKSDIAGWYQSLAKETLERMNG